MKTLELDPEDVNEVLDQIEQSFNVDFQKASLADIQTFGKLVDWISASMPQLDTDDCTNQQAFYKLRDELCGTLAIDKANVSPSTELATLFDEKTREKQTKQLEQRLGFPVNILVFKPIFIYLTVAIFLASFVVLYIKPLYGICGFVCWFGLVNLFSRIPAASTFSIKTVGELAKKVSRERYLWSRRNPGTINSNELMEKVKQLFVAGTAISYQELTPHLIIPYS
ncbi:hypothetical protein [Spirosoma sp. KUDC1026]|uniref:hypothetical protein n=1 Tax=Spirosoma sp. KUDC1026 TaxID=2745947 RepID=UPI00159BEBA9|nr:hypothetical protein [Spirosoma sp. KUDC1026]QKZ13608.1 hypothetical protein HU175_13585 [Spirosoma sp. KUDC1026]